MCQLLPASSDGFQLCSSCQLPVIFLLSLAAAVGLAHKVVSQQWRHECEQHVTCMARKATALPGLWSQLGCMQMSGCTRKSTHCKCLAHSMSMLTLAADTCAHLSTRCVMSRSRKHKGQLRWHMYASALHFDCSAKFRHRDSNPGRSGEGRVS